MFQAPRGTHDVLAADVVIRRQSVATAQRLAELAGYQPIEPPLFEAADLFVRSMGEATDVVEKEMYTFEDRGGERLALLPEGTASICRAYLEHGMANDPQPAKLYYTLPIFRYERPQAGRYRQHTQFGVEAIGVRDPALDAEVIELGWRITQELGLRSLTLLFNSIGDPADRQRYVVVLREYFAPHLDQLCSDCRRRFERAPLRLLDCKERSCRPFQADAPRISAYLSAESRAFANAVKEHLAALGIPLREDPTLMRGLDYYSHTVFEIVPAQRGSQGTVIAGGRYDGLIEQIGGRPTPGIGFGLGLERLALNLRQQGLAPPPPPAPPVLLVPMGERAAVAATRLAAALRRAGLGATLGFGERSLKAQLRHADRARARFAIIIGERELAAGEATIRDLRSSEQRTVAMDAVVAELTASGPYTDEDA